MRRFRLCSPLNCFIVPVYVLLFFSSEIVSVRAFEPHLELPIKGSITTRPESNWVLSVADFGAKGDGISDDTWALKSAWDIACSSPVKTIILVPSRTYLIHPLNLGGPCSSRITLKIHGTIVAPKDPEAWLGHSQRKWLYFYEVNHLTVEGGGTIRGMGQEWWSRSCKTNSSNPCQHAPTAMTFHKCTKLKVRNLVLLDSQQMHVAFTNCFRVWVSRLKLIAPSSSPNTDGVHISSSTRVEVKDSNISTGDDCISIVGNSSRIRIKRIECGPGHGISIGSLGKSNSMSQVNDVKVNGASLFNTENGVRIKTWQGGNGFVSKITFQNLSMKNVSNPIIIDQYYCDSPQPCLNQSSAVKVKDVSFIGIRGTSATEDAIKFTCSDSSPCEGLYLEDIELILCDGGPTISSCWEAYGSSYGFVYPSACSFPVYGLIQERDFSGREYI